MSQLMRQVIFRSQLTTRAATPSAAGCATTLLTTSRMQSTDQHHRFLNRPHIVQPDNLDSLPRTKGDQQLWLNTEQWDGYSDTYLKQFMQYTPANEHPMPQVSYRNSTLNECLGVVFSIYGPLAEDLQVLHDDPLHPRFHERIKKIKKGREALAVHLDKVYAELHPTVKTLYDAFVVRRYYHLEDWIKHVEKKRETLFERLSPEHIAQVEKARGLSSAYIERLKALGQVMENAPLSGLLESHDQYSELELAALKQKVSYFRKMRKFGSSADEADFRPL